MTFAWTPHRFSGGALALDVANSVVLRFDPKRRIDRFEEPGQLAAFAPAAAELSQDRDAAGSLSSVEPGGEARFLALREAIDAHFRTRVLTGNDDNRLLADLLTRIAEVLAAYPASKAPCSVDLAAARSALRLVASDASERLKICPNCEWLFVDRSKNRSRTWCDMAVCGNRAKARLHYRRKQKGQTP
jgi:predicted RNA-binding Zn ribbon-like protein